MGVVTLEDLRSLLPAPTGGNRKKTFLEVLRPLGEEDAHQLLEPDPVGYNPNLVKRLRTQHHTLARMLAQHGSRDIDVSHATGYSTNRIALLKQDPAFKELMAYYHAQAEQQFVDVHARLAGLGTAVVEELQERLEEAPESFTTKDLLAMGEFTLDRSIAPPKTRNQDRGAAAPAITISFHSGESLPLLSVPTIDSPADSQGDYV